MRATSRKSSLAVTTVAAALFAAAGALAAGPVAAPTFATQLAASDAPEQLPRAADKGEYEQEVGSRIDQWKQKVSEFTSRAKAEGEDAAEAAAEQVNSAWATVQEKWSQLRNASAETWDDTKTAFENAWGDFRRAWQDAASES